MSDYLNNIVARSLNVAEVVQPRLPQMFEQVSPVLPGLADPGIPDYDAARESELTEGRSHLQQPTQSPIMLVSDKPAQIRSQSRDIQPTTIGFGPATPMNAQPATSAQTAQTSPARENVEPRRLEEDSGKQNNYPSSETESLLVAIPESATLSPQDRTNRNLDPGPASQPQTVSPRLASIRESRFVGPTPAEIPGYRKEPQAPTIKITIGRVDVRAIMPPPPRQTPVPTRPKPSLSLDDYLRQREEGKR